MISSYLEFVKYQRKFSIEDARIFLKIARLCKDGWARGYYRGLSQAKSFESRHWRRLQKDIEAHDMNAQSICVFNHGTGYVDLFLS